MTCMKSMCQTYMYNIIAFNTAVTCIHICIYVFYFTFQIETVNVSNDAATNAIPPQGMELQVIHVITSTNADINM